ncbi:hypothetical protein CLOM_g2387 [Closterium sp. NIES-68]|nr:hypothetical protein CLOM_g17969 [Closterium sp. NIES-68]GJP42854.1 hypothetical protein CLOM_g2387 [Closterium sp. NIES-68]GJP67739.1 hypothetical protein CLOP_g24520 [Closterium sp. NIES-67]GJP85660.1 hypothetical protein CLOP_g15771 [Closterium sp. NIES-67]
MEEWEVEEGEMGSDEEEEVEEGSEDRGEKEEGGEEGSEERGAEEGGGGADKRHGDATGARRLRLEANCGAAEGRSDNSESDSEEGDEERSGNESEGDAMEAEKGEGSGEKGRKRRKGEGLGVDGQGKGEKRKQAKLTKGKKRHKTGVCYLSRIPPRMKPLKLRHLLSPHAEILRIYLAPEDPAARQRRRAAGGSRNKNFTEGWVEFERKRDAKRVAALLNGQPMGGKNRSHHRFDLWTIKYLKRFKWDNLSEEIAYRRAVRDQKLEAEMRVAAKERDAYVTRVQQSKVLQRRQAKAAKKAKAPAAAGAAEGGEKAPRQQALRHYMQRGAIGEGQEEEEGRLMSRGVLGKVLG